MTEVPNRDPELVMRLAQLGSFHQSRLSFKRVLTRRMAAEGWRFDCTAFEIDGNGEGHAVYTAQTPERTYSLIAFAHDLPPEKRSDRVIAEAWDATFTLFDGVPEDADIQRLAQNIPLQEAGRVTGRELSVSRANRSVRLWEHVVASIAAGDQPETAQIEAVGYLMRTTAVYGSGKLGAADREMIADRPEFRVPFQVEMLSVYLTRWFVTDLVQHMACCRAQQNGTTAAKLAPQIARSLGIGNSTGLGMAPFLLNHPVLFNNWIAARETALSRVRGIDIANGADIALFQELLNAALCCLPLGGLNIPCSEKLAALQADVAALRLCLQTIDLSAPHPWDRLYQWAEQNLSLEGQEWVVSLLLEPYGALVDDLAETMAADNTATFRIAGAMTIADLRALLERVYHWAIETDWSLPANRARAWYVSEEKLEPRLGERFEEPVEEYEQPLAPGRDAAALHRALAHWPDDAQVAEFILRHPEHRHALRRAQIVGRAPYAEIRDNTISERVMPIDMLRCKLAFFGATKFDPRSDRWLRICMYGNAPLPPELTPDTAEYWPYPDLPKGDA